MTGVVPFLVLLAMGIGWGLTLPLAKIAVSTGHEPYGLIFWQFVVVVAVLAPISLTRRARPRVRLGRQHLMLFTALAMFGALLPDVFFYIGAVELPAGVLSITAATAPMFALIIALAVGNDTFSWPRIAGISLGLGGVILMIGPEASLPDPGMAFFVLLTLLAPALYATEANIVSKFGTLGLDPMQTIVGASTVGMIVALPLAFLTDQWVDPFANFGAAELALIAAAALHAVVYATYVWLVGRAGSVFASQSAYIVTATGVVASMIMLQESYSMFIWLALGVMLLGVFLVQPRAAQRLTPVAEVDNSHVP
ncbi:MAG: DMT family transporter [Pseudomonadota bacterium]